MCANQVVWSAATASSAVPGIFEPQALLVKDLDGTVQLKAFLKENLNCVRHSLVAVLTLYNALFGCSSRRSSFPKSLHAGARGVQRGLPQRRVGGSGLADGATVGAFQREPFPCVPGHADMLERSRVYLALHSWRLLRLVYTLSILKVPLLFSLSCAFSFCFRQMPAR